MIVINITKEIIDTKNGIVDEVSGIIIDSKYGKICFDLFKTSDIYSFKLRIYNDLMAIIVDEFGGKFYSYDYRNRAIINWLGENIKTIMEKI